MKDLWLTWDKLESLLIDNEVVFFGSGEWAEKTLRKINKKPLFILDNSEIMQNTKLCGVDIVHPNYIEKIKDKYIILITTGSYHTVMEQLKNIGLKETENFYCSPVLYNQKIEKNIKNNDQTLLFTCSNIPEPEKAYSGGGLYSFNTKDKQLTKHISGKFHEIVKTEKVYYIVDEFKGIVIFDKKYKQLDIYKGLPGSIMHGLSYNEEQNILYLANTGRDSISIIDAKSGKHLDEVYISRKNKEGEADRHHINDLCYYKGDLYISMFSFSGLWREGCYDGGVAKFDLKEGRIVGYPINNMWMPHSIDFINGEIVIANSMCGYVNKTNNKTLVDLGGFIRGVAHDGKYYYIGQSEHRYFDRLKDISKNIQINCGIHVYDDVNKASRFYSFEDMSDIHSIIVKD